MASGRGRRLHRRQEILALARHSTRTASFLTFLFKAARRLMRKLLRKTTKTPRVMITDKLLSYGAARKDMA